MRSLDDAWQWYEQTSNLLYLMQRLGKRYWKTLPWDGPLGHDENFNALAEETVDQQAASSLDSIDELAVIVLFSVFESVVRENAQNSMKLALQAVDHPILRTIGTRALDSIEKGPLAPILDSYKALDANLVMEVNQVRDYRNWVAHGKRGRPVANIEPKDAYRRLSRFLAQYVSAPFTDEFT